MSDTNGMPEAHIARRSCGCVAGVSFNVHYTNPGEVVLDSCAGSGTTEIDCINLDRWFILIEKDDKYYEIARSRISKELDR